MESSDAWSKQMRDLSESWLEWYKRILKSNEWPLSGNVNQVIHAMGEKIGQFGFFNITFPGSRNPPLEWSILARWSYGRQLGRIIDLLGPLVDAYGDEWRKKHKELEKPIDEFKALRDEIADLRKPKADVLPDK